MKLKKVDIPFYLNKSNLNSSLLYHYKYIKVNQYHKSTNSSEKEVEIKIPWHITNNIEEAQSVLAKMLNSLPKDSSLYKYLVSECH
jgi:hypothetical protein